MYSYEGEGGTYLGGSVKYIQLTNLRHCLCVAERSRAEAKSNGVATSLPFGLRIGEEAQADITREGSYAVKAACEESLNPFV